MSGARRRSRRERTRWFFILAGVLSVGLLTATSGSLAQQSRPVAIQKQITPSFAHPSTVPSPPTQPTQQTLETQRRNDATTPQTQARVLRMQLMGANTQPSMTGLEKLPGIVNYVIGNDPQKWRKKIYDLDKANSRVKSGAVSHAQRRFAKLKR